MSVSSCYERPQSSLESCDFDEDWERTLQDGTQPPRVNEIRASLPTPFEDSSASRILLQVLLAVALTLVTLAFTSYASHQGPAAFSSALSLALLANAILIASLWGQTLAITPLWQVPIFLTGVMAIRCLAISLGHSHGMGLGDAERLLWLQVGCVWLCRRLLGPLPMAIPRKQIRGAEWMSGIAYLALTITLWRQASPSTFWLEGRSLSSLLPLFSLMLYGLMVYGLCRDDASAKSRWLIRTCLLALPLLATCYALSAIQPVPLLITITSLIAACWLLPVMQSAILTESPSSHQNGKSHSAPALNVFSGPSIPSARTR